MAKCPKCEKTITYTNLKGLESKEPFGGKAWKAVAHCCPHCDSAFSVEIDPIALRSDIINGVKRALGR